jgi:S-DNA-T family DNA segregation ATPase FtsK/SpoIIIE
VEVITGLIKANITTRIAFQVATQIDSRTILDMGGAEKLLGNGDMLFVSAASLRPKRLQGTFVSEAEVKKVVKFLKDQSAHRGKKEGDEIVIKEAQREILEFKKVEADEDDDVMVQMAKEEIFRSQKASASFLQRRLRIGYSRAARILDILEGQGIVGPPQGAKPREIYGVPEEENVNYEDKTKDQEKRDKWQI